MNISDSYDSLGSVASQLYDIKDSNPAFKDSYDWYIDKLTPPDLALHIVWVLEAFGMLSHSRTYNMSGPNPICLQSMESYIRMHETTVDTDSFIKTIQYLDTIYIKHAIDKSKENDNSSNSNRSKK